VAPPIACARHGRAVRSDGREPPNRVRIPLLDFSLVAEEQKKEYIAAVQAGLDKNFKPMEMIFAAIIERTVAES
jgi:hypothetical protein